MIKYKKLRLTNYNTIESGSIVINKQNLSTGVFKEQKAEFPKWLLKIIFMMIVFPLISVGMLGLNKFNKAVIIPEVILILIYIFGIMRYERNLKRFVLIFFTNEGKEHLFFVKDEETLKLVKDFIFSNKAVEINLGNGKYKKI